MKTTQEILKFIEEILYEDSRYIARYQQRFHEVNTPPMWIAQGKVDAYKCIRAFIKEGE